MFVLNMYAIQQKKSAFVTTNPPGLVCNGNSIFSLHLPLILVAPPRQETGGIVLPIIRFKVQLLWFGVEKVRPLTTSKPYFLKMFVSSALDDPDIKKNGKIFKKALRRSSDL